VPSLGIEKDTAPQIFGLLGGGAGYMVPGIVIGQKHAIVLAAPALGPIRPIGSRKVEYFPCP
jgi:hypothetical protein